jgi:hypothetical protein
MSTFKRYIEDATEIMTEKVSKKEITEALKNKNLYVGAEFEMIIPGDQMMGGVDRSEISDAYDNAYRDWQKYMDDISDWEKEAQTYEEETETMSSDIDVLGDAISELDDYANDEEEFQKEWIEGEVLDNWVFTNNHDHVYTIVPGRLHKPFDIKEFDTIKKLEKMIKSLDAVKDDMESTISYREDEGRYEEVTMPYLLDGRFANYIDYMRDIYDNFGYGEDSGIIRLVIMVHLIHNLEVQCGQLNLMGHWMQGVWKSSHHLCHYLTSLKSCQRCLIGWMIMTTTPITAQVSISICHLKNHLRILMPLNWCYSLMRGIYLISFPVG